MLDCIQGCRCPIHPCLPGDGQNIKTGKELCEIPQVLRAPTQSWVWLEDRLWGAKRVAGASFITEVIPVHMRPLLPLSDLLKGSSPTQMARVEFRPLLVPHGSQEGQGWAGASVAFNEELKEVLVGVAVQEQGALGVTLTSRAGDIMAS